VAKTARKLLIELQKCYPVTFENNLVASLKSEDDKIICKAVLRNDEDEIQRILSTVGNNNGSSTGTPPVTIAGAGPNNRRVVLDESKSVTSSQSTYNGHASGKVSNL
jgi:hypothetical protein